MKGVLIDSKHRIVSIVEVSNSGINDILTHLNCDIFTVAMQLKNRDVMYVDDEGLINGTDSFFTYEGAHQPFAGNGLILGTDSEGESVDCKVELMEVAKKVNFYTIEELAIMFDLY
jgi:hypothetical protein